MAAVNYGPKANPEPVRVHDFAIPELGKAVPYGIYDVSANAGFVNVGISADTGEFSVASIRRWWYAVGAPRYPDARKILINADCGGSNGARLRLWKRELQCWPTNFGSRSLSAMSRLAPAVESTTGAVAVGLEGSCFPATFVLPVPHWFGPLLRFQSPLVKPDMQISRIRLSPASSGLRARPVRAASRQGV